MNGRNLRGRLGRLEKTRPPDASAPVLPGVFWDLCSAPPDQLDGIIAGLTPDEARALEAILGGLSEEPDDEDDLAGWI